MSAGRLLIVLAADNCPPEIFSMINGLARCPDKTVLLLCVLEPGVSEAVCRAVRRDLERLERTHLHLLLDSRVAVRSGRADEEILAEARVVNAHQIVLANDWPNLSSRFVPNLGEVKKSSDPLETNGFKDEAHSGHVPCGKGLLLE